MKLFEWPFSLLNKGQPGRNWLGVEPHSRMIQEFLHHKLLVEGFWHYVPSGVLVGYNLPFFIGDTYISVAILAQALRHLLLLLPGQEATAQVYLSCEDHGSSSSIDR